MTGPNDSACVPAVWKYSGEITFPALKNPTGLIYYPLGIEFSPRNRRNDEIPNLSIVKSD
jgi:hypothetical protein